MVEIGRQNDFATIKVSNTGSSIPYNERGRIFERFYRGASLNVEIAGSGLGLYVARKIALAEPTAPPTRVPDHSLVPPVAMAHDVSAEPRFQDEPARAMAVGHRPLRTGDQTA